MGEDNRKLPAEEEGIVFRYDRKRRIERASDDARWLAARAGAKRPGILGSLLATRASRILFFTIIGLALYFFSAPLFEGRAQRSGTLGEARYSVSALYYEGRVLVALTRRGGAETGGRLGSLLVSAQAGGKGEDFAPVSFEFVIGALEREEYRLAVPAGSAKPEWLRLRLAGMAGSLELFLALD